jgi:hypothetical protein
MARNRRLEARLQAAAPASEPQTDPLRDAITREQEKAYATLGLAETIHLRGPLEAVFDKTPWLIDQILAKHYADQTKATKAYVRRHLESELIHRDKQSPLPLQNERYHRHLMRHWNRIQQHMPEFGTADMAIPYVATMPLPQLNAETWKLAHHDGYAIVFNEALLTFLFLLSKIVARYFPGEIITNKSRPQSGILTVLFDRAHVNKVLTTDFSGLQDLINLLTAHIYKGNPLADTKPYLLERQPNAVAGHLVSFSELFVFAHELAHIAHGDLVGARVERIPGLADDFDVLRPEQQQELNADAKALIALIKICERSLGPYYLSLVYCAAEMFFAAVELSSRSVTFLKFGEEREIHADTHPPISIRRANLRQVLQHHAPWPSATVPPFAEWEVAVSHADILVDLVDALWRDARRALDVARKTGHPISPRWDSL